MLGLSTTIASSSYVSRLRSDDLAMAFASRVTADGGTVENTNDLEKDLRKLI
tara:strand:- start:28298 stop:28453 length:156 start_codon:yes stop_codon:yes gene_type:complete